MDLSCKIKLIRKSQFLTQEEFAKLIGVSFCTVNRWENNKSLPNLSALKKIREFCIKYDIDNPLMVMETEE